MMKNNDNGVTVLWPLKDGVGQCRIIHRYGTNEKGEWTLDPTQGFKLPDDAVGVNPWDQVVSAREGYELYLTGKLNNLVPQYFWVGTKGKPQWGNELYSRGDALVRSTLKRETGYILIPAYTLTEINALIPDKYFDPHKELRDMVLDGGLDNHGQWEDKSEVMPIPKGHEEVNARAKYLLYLINTNQL